MSDIDYGQMSDVETFITPDYSTWGDAELLQYFNAPSDGVFVWDREAIEYELRDRNLLS